MPTAPRPARKTAAPARAAAPAAITRQLAAAQQHCQTQGGQLTDLRREVLELLLLRRGRAKAYDLQEDMTSRRGRVAPMTVYRALDFLVEQGLVHRVDANNSFVVCNGHHDHGHHGAVMLVCAQCDRVTEWHNDAAIAALRHQLGEADVDFLGTSIEIKGLCASCRASAADLDAPPR
jgi:Fur family zinc uptake transcriptional regulator